MIKKISNIHALKLASNRFINGSVPMIRLVPKAKKNAPQVTAHGHDQNIFSDIPATGNDPITLEILADKYSETITPQKNIRASMVSTGAVREAKTKNYVTVIEQSRHNTMIPRNKDMPYGHDVLRDKQQNKALLLTLKKRYGVV